MQGGIQRYHCNTCALTFQSRRRPGKRHVALFRAYVWERQNIAQLAKRTGHSPRWVRQQLDRAVPRHQMPIPQSTPIAADVTFWGRRYGVAVFRSPTLKRNLWWKEVTEETPLVYAEGLCELQKRGWTITSAVLDGKRGVARIFKAMPVQICQFHQVKTVTTYLTRKPKTPAGWELRGIALRLARSTEKEFSTLLASWFERWKGFLAQRTPCSCCKANRWPYTHRKLRAAYRSLNANLPFLFTYQKYQGLHLPNTTNTLDGMFSQIKNRLAVHRGAKKEFRYKIIQEILSGSN
jgi:hypothetical protein